MNDKTTTWLALRLAACQIIGENCARALEDERDGLMKELWRDLIAESQTESRKVIDEIKRRLEWES